MATEGGNTGLLFSFLPLYSTFNLTHAQNLKESLSLVIDYHNLAKI